MEISQPFPWAQNASLSSFTNSLEKKKKTQDKIYWLVEVRNSLDWTSIETELN